MKNFLKGAVCAAIVCSMFIPAFVSGGAAAADKIVDVYLIAGQSNAVGYGYDDLEENGFTDERLKNGYDNVLFYGRYESDKEVPAGLAEVKKGLGKNWTNGQSGSGAEIGVAAAVSDLADGGVSAVIKCAWGATFLAPDTGNAVSVSQGTWTPPSYIEKYSLDTNGGKIGAMYSRFLQTVRDGLNLLKSEGYTPVLKGMWWMQGEAECPDRKNAAAYEELLTCLISDVRADLCELTEQDSAKNLPFVLGKIYRNPEFSQFAYIDEVRQAQQNAADKLPNVFAVDCTGLPQQDGWHFYASAQLWLGRQFAETVLTSEGKFKVSVEGEGVSVTGSGIKRAGENVSVRVQAQRGYKLAGLSVRVGADGAEESVRTDENGYYSFVMPADNVFIKAETEALPMFRLILAEVSDAAGGSVFAGADAKNGWYEGESVSLALTVSEGYEFAGAAVNGKPIVPSDSDERAYYFTISEAADVKFYAEVRKVTVAPPPEPEPPEQKEGCKSALGAEKGFGLLFAAGAAAAVKKKR